MSPDAALARLSAIAENGWVHLDEVRRILPRVHQTPDGLTITDAEAGLILGLLDGRPLSPAGLEVLETMTGRLHTISPPTGTHRLPADEEPEAVW